MTTFRLFFSDEAGASAIEYSLLIGMIALVIVTAAMGVGTKVSKQFSTVATKLN